MLAWKIAPALAAGNTVVLKPAEFTPLTALAFAEICVEVGLPAGVVNIVTGDGATGAALVGHPDVDKIAFTGSTEVGRAIRQATAGTDKKLSLELGGKSPFVVFEDADLDSAVEGVVDAIWFNQGQVCCAGSRLLVAESVAEPMYAKLRARMEKLRVGDPLDKSIDVGAIVAPVQLERIKRLVEGEKEGAQGLARRDPCPERLFLSADAGHRRRAGVDPGARGDLRAGAGGDDLPHAGRSDRARQQHPLRPRRLGVDRERQSRVRSRLEDQGRRGVDQFDQPVRRRLRFRRLSRKRLRPRGRARGTGRIPDRRRAGGPGRPSRASSGAGNAPARPTAPRAIDRTAKLYIGGKQARPDSGYCYAVLDPDGKAVGLAGLGNRKDVRNAVEAAAKAGGWGAATAHNRAQVLYYLAENLSAAQEFAERLSAQTGASAREARAEVETAVRRAFYYAGFADKFDGAVHATKTRFVTLAMNEPWGVMGIVCPDEAPLIGFVSLVLPAIAMGNSVVVSPRPDIRSALPTSIRCSTRPTCPPASSTSSPARRRRWPRRSPSTTASTRCGASARELAKTVEPPPPPTSRRPGLACRRATGPTSRAATTCAARPK